MTFKEEFLNCFFSILPKALPFKYARLVPGLFVPVNIGYGKDLVASGDKPLPQPMLLNVH